MGPASLPSHVILRHHPRSKRLRLAIDYRLRKAVLTAPPRTGVKDIRDFLEKTREWVQAKLGELPSADSTLSQILLEGVPHKVIGGEKITIHNEAQTILLPLHEPHAKDLLVRLLKQRARARLLAHCQVFSKQLGVTFKKMTLRDTKGRWGSCSSAGNLNFSWRLILAPPDVLTYVCAHEVAHLLEMNHSPRFWKLVEKVHPSYKRQRDWLKKNSKHLLMAL